MMPPPPTPPPRRRRLPRALWRLAVEAALILLIVGLLVAVWLPAMVS